jgi:hypothetical protein
MNATQDDESSAEARDQPAPLRLILKVDRSTEIELAARSRRMTRTGQPLRLDPVARSVQFLRGIGNRVTMALPAFYMFYAADTRKKAECSIDGFAGVVTRSYLNFSSANTIALCTRQAFDHAGKGANLTGKGFASSSDQVLAQHAEFWAKKSGRPEDDALSALLLLRRLFDDCSKKDTVLLAEDSPLATRVGLLKQYADRNVAHLSSDVYEVGLLDVAHVVAALTIVGEVIRSFDDSRLQQDYFNDLDEAAAHAAGALFPSTTIPRLFKRMDVEAQARACWKVDVNAGLDMLHRRLPYAIGWW